MCYNTKNAVNVYNTFATSGSCSGAVLKNIPVKTSVRFTCVEAAGKTRSYSRVEKLESFFMRC